MAEASYLLHRGVPRHRILMERASYDTIGNAYFSLAIHVLPRNFRELLVITSAFHMPRTRAIFEWIYGLAGIAALSFETVPDIGMEKPPFRPAAPKKRMHLPASPVSGTRSIA